MAKNKGVPIHLKTNGSTFILKITNCKPMGSIAMQWKTGGILFITSFKTNYLKNYQQQLVYSYTKSLTK